MRDYTAIKAELQQRRDEHHHHSQGEQVATKLRELDKQIKLLMSEMTASLTQGADSCECGAWPHGMEIRPDVFEVGCLTCKGKRARGPTPDLAVKRWNSGVLYVTQR